MVSGSRGTRYTIIFDKIILRQLKKLGRDKELRERLSKMLDRIEEKGPRAGKVVDSVVHLYEIKSKHPPIRLYFKVLQERNQVHVFEYELKKSPKRQKKTIHKIKGYLKKLKP